jgi:hypothetical protein
MDQAPKRLPTSPAATRFAADIPGASFELRPVLLRGIEALARLLAGQVELHAQLVPQPAQGIHLLV